MFIELVGSLRCIRPHELTWLVAGARQMDGRDITRGELGCHVCGAEYPIVDGVADFTAGVPPRAAVTLPAPREQEEAAMRVAALLDLAEPGGFVTLAGTWGAAAPLLAEMVQHVHLLLLNAPVEIASGNGISLARVHDDVPVRPAACRGIALDESHSSPALVAAAVAALRLRGRLLAPASLPVPAGITVLARDAHHWVGEKERVAGPMVQLEKS
jgi:hypothetical protein